MINPTNPPPKPASPAPGAPRPIPPRPATPPSFTPRPSFAPRPAQPPRPAAPASFTPRPRPVSTPPIAPKPVAPIPTGKNNKTALIIIIIAVIIVAVVGYLAYSKWQARRTAQGILQSAVQNNAEILGQMAGQLVGQAAEEEPKTPEGIYDAAASIDIADNKQKALADEVGTAIKAALGDFKISGFTSGYMGMNSGSCVVQYTLKKTLALADINAVSDELKKLGLDIVGVIQENNTATILAQKGNAAYTVGFNKDEQEITAVIIMDKTSK